LVLFNDEIEVGTKYNGRVLLKNALDLERSITLKSGENQFTIQMASNNGGVKNHTRFVYRLKGFNDKWIKTTSSNSDITYMGLPAGSYTLCVRMLKDDGTMGDTESQLDITIEGPWYTSWWAFLIYVLLLGFAVWGWLQREQIKQLLTPQQAEESRERKDEDVIPVDDEDVEEAVLMDD
jgi:hypothetical protein